MAEPTKTERLSLMRNTEKSVGLLLAYIKHGENKEIENIKNAREECMSLIQRNLSRFDKDSREVMLKLEKAILFKNWNETYKIYQQLKILGQR